MKYNSLRPRRLRISPAMRALVRENEVKVSDAAKRIGVSTKSASRCFDELEYLNIDVLGMKGKSRVINIPNDRKQVWQQIENVLRNPVIRRFVLREDMKLEKKRH